jgi:hypothetical protein
MYVRFVISQLDEDSHRSLGIFHAAFNLRDGGLLYPHEEANLEELRLWFNANLKKPTRFTSSKPPYYRKKNKAVSWFKDSARQHIAKIREMAAILENHGIAIRMLKTERVGYVVYEDEWQVVAEPFSDVIC